MTYSYPKYIEIDNVESTFSSKYKLYIYRDGYRDSDTLYGTPALFIPGQAGSYGQIRSLASTTTQLYHQNREGRKNIDFFTVDLNEELSALSGQNLIDQAVYLNAVIKRIQDMYQRPVPVMIIGHSMGGIVARTMFMQPNYIPYSIRTIVTIATPHLVAPLLLDTGIYKAYKDIKTYWKTHQDQLKDVVLISIAGGSLDNIIHSDGVVIDKVVSKTNGFTTYTTSIPGVWTGCDHMAILWCKQFIQVLSSTLLSVVNGGSTVEERMRVFEYHLLQGTRIQQQIQAVDINKLVNRGVQPRWSIVGCNDLERLDCSYVKPKVTLIPSGTAENLIGSNPYRLLQIVNDGFKYIGVVDHGGDKILDGDNEVFLIGRSVSDKPVVHPYHVWGNVYMKGIF
ncbi:PGAP1-like protein-domain-containing protein [Thamnidium elegans]|nr:PGAP1-like protein-domain-containing protein [Thamnidium elegans]